MKILPQTLRTITQNRISFNRKEVYTISYLIPLELTAAAKNAAIHKKMFESGITILIVSNEEMNDIMEIVKSLEESGLLMNGISEAINS